MWVKICGTTSLADALLAIEHGADALGFIFAPSKRRITAAQAAAITAHLPAGVERVGVFTSADSADPAKIVSTVAAAGLTAVQLHLPHDPALTAELHRQLGSAVHLIQVVGVQVIGVQADPALTALAGPTIAAQAAAGVNEGRLRAALADPSLWAILLDTEKDGQSGGLGLAFPWQALQPVLRQVLAEMAPPALSEERGQEHRPEVHPHPSHLSHTSHVRLLLAGGLHAGNVERAIHALAPWGVDCVSGVEAEPGRKDPARLAAFLKAAHLKLAAPQG